MNTFEHIYFEGIIPAPRRFGRSFPSLRKVGETIPLRSRRTPVVEVDPFIGWVLKKNRLDVRSFRSVAIQRRLAACLRHLRVSSGEAAKALLERKPELMSGALNVLLIGVTGFFRDPNVFNTLETAVIPTLTIEVEKGKRLRVYSAGASNGHELYSVAILLAEAGVLSQSHLTGVDCRPGAVRNARAGQFTETDLAGVKPEWRARYFDPTFTGYAVRSQFRKCIDWQVGDLSTFQADKPWNLILFRNVVIYFDDDHADVVWRHLYSCLAPGGFLVTGKAEKPLESLGMSRIAPCVYRKLGIE